MTPISIDAGSNRSYGLDWSTLGLPEGVTVVASAWAVTSGPLPLVTLSGQSFDGGMTKVRITGGALHKKYTVTNTVTLSDGCTYRHSFVVLIVRA